MATAAASICKSTGPSSHERWLKKAALPTILDLVGMPDQHLQGGGTPTLRSIGRCFVGALHGPSDKANDKVSVVNWNFGMAPPITTRKRTSPDVGEVPNCDIGRFYSMTSSAVASSNGGTVTPSAVAVFRLITRSNFSGRCIGKSLGFGPCRIFPT
jgi:hypothetical protein